MPRHKLQEQLGDYAMRIQADNGWTATREEHTAALGRLVDAYIADTDLYRELAAVRSAAAREREGYEFEIATLRAQLAAREGVTV
jgi:hypothetical protein